MKRSVVRIAAVASVLAPLAAGAAGKTAPSTATYIMKDEIDKVGATEQSKTTRDENIKIVDIGYENFALGIVHRASTRIPAVVNAPPQGQPCGRMMASLPAGGTPGGITHDLQAEGYYILSGGGTMFTDGYIVNGRHNNQDPQGGPNGPTCGGMAYGVKKVAVKPGDVVIIPPNVVHGWADIPDHVDYLSFRPSQNQLQAGWVNPTIAK